jgi:tRNA-dihydrouridine synthase B
MGCQAKKVCNLQAGSALMANEQLALAIIDSVANAVSVPVTVKMRTGPDRQRRNAVHLARLAEAAGAALITVHGRSRACGFTGHAEYDTIAEVKSAVSVPVVANGDIGSPAQALAVLQHTHADGVMIGRAAQGRPWIFREIAAALDGRAPPAAPEPEELRALLREHLIDHYEFHGPFTGVRTARKHVGWYLGDAPGAIDFLRNVFYPIETPEAQLAALERWFDHDSPGPVSDSVCEMKGLPQ